MNLRISAFLLTLLLCVSLCARDFNFAGSEYANYSVEIREIISDKVLVDINAQKMLTPASTMKLVTTAAALCKYAPDYHYSTEARFIGKIETDGTAKGNIVIKAAGDPTLYSKHSPEKQTFISDITTALQAMCVKYISGDVIIDNTCMPGAGPQPTWLIEDAFYAYGTGVYPLNYADNTFKLEVDNLTTSPAYPDAEITYSFVPGEDLQRFHGAFTNQYAIKGDAPAKTSLIFPVNNPMDCFKKALKQQLETVEIRFTEPCGEPVMQPESYLIATYTSPELAEIMKSLMWRSDNMMAEATLRLLLPGGTLQDALDEEKEILKNHLGVENRYVKILDGSGLTRKNFVSANFLGNVLGGMAKSSRAKDFVNLFPKAGMEGTVKRLFAKSPLKGRLALKSGSMNGVRCYAGYYLDTEGNPTHSVVIMINDFVAPTAEVNKAIEQFLSTKLIPLQ